jgi:4-hydroxythreonine-4-phosphate dehydrogenase
MSADGTLPIAVSIGDPAGIGPEIIVKAWARRAELALPRFYVIGDGACLQRAAARLNVDIAALSVESTPLAVVEQPGQPDARNGAAIIAAIKSGVEAAQADRATALVTCPIAKSVLYESGFRFPGHTEYVAHLCATPPQDGPLMMLAAADLKVALVTIHQPLREAAASLTAEGIVRAGLILGAALKRDFAIARPRIALAGLNPHAGEDGALGREEIEIINPAAEALRRAGIEASNARPSDALFHSEARKTYDAVLAMYHDQGLIPIKTLDFWGGVNTTLGLPIVRTSPDHGTAFDAAGKGIAREDSFVAALRMAAEVSARRRAFAPA